MNSNWGIATVVIAALTLAGCSSSTTPGQGAIEGEAPPGIGSYVLATNGSFAVGEYLTFNEPLLLGPVEAGRFRLSLQPPDATTLWADYCQTGQDVEFGWAILFLLTEDSDVRSSEGVLGYLVFGTADTYVLWFYSTAAFDYEGDCGDLGTFDIHAPQGWSTAVFQAGVVRSAPVPFDAAWRYSEDVPW